MEKIYEGCGIIAFKTERAIEVWSDDGDQRYGEMPLGTHTDALVAAAKFWTNGKAAGIKTGMAQVRGEFRAALGL